MGRRFGDLWIGLVLAIITCILGFAYLVYTVDTVGYAYKFSTSYLVPSAMYASGHGYINPPFGAIPAVDAFINEQTPELVLPKDLNVDAYPAADWYYRDHWYLFVSVGWIWRLFGVTWTAYKLLPAILLACTAVGAYALFRLVAGRVVSVLGTVVFLACPAVLSITPALRDMSKAPFILALVWGLLWLSSRTITRRRLFVAALALGALNGFGLGFRSDLLVCVPPAVAVLALAVKGADIPLTWRHRATAVALFLVGFGMVGSPVLLHRTNQGSSPAHHITCGLAPECNAYLGVEPASYETVYYFGDAFAHAVANSYGHRVQGVEEPIPYLTDVSQDAQGAFVLDVFLRFPGDLATRMLASTARILGDGFTRVDLYRYPENVVVEASERILSPLATVLEATKLIVPACVFLGIAAVNLRAALAGLLLFLFFTGYTCLQFHLRHYFHLTLAPLWFAAAFATGLLHLRRQPWRDRAAIFLGIKGMAFFMLVVLLLVYLPWQGARRYQAWQLHRYTTRLAETARTPLDFATATHDGRVFTTLTKPIDRAPESTGDQVWEVQTDYVLVTLTPSSETRTLRIAYDAETSFNDFSLDVAVPPAPDGGPAHYYFPLYQSLHHSVAGTENPFPGFDGRWGKSVFSGVSVAEASGNTVTGMYRLNDLSSFSTLLNVAMSPDGEVVRPWQRLRLHLPDTGEKL